MIASKIRKIWFNDVYSLYSLPGSLASSYTVLTETEEDAIELLKKDIQKYIEYAKLIVDVYFLWFEISITKVENNHITWLFTRHRVVKFTDNVKKILPDVSINYYRK